MNSNHPQPKSKKYSPKFIFMDGENEIIFINSYSAIEYVYINGQEVYSHRRISKESVVEIEHNSNTYRFEVDVKNIMLGPVVCSFYKNGDIVSIKKLIYKNMLNYYSFITLAVVLVTLAVTNYNASIIVYFVVTLILFGIGRIVFPIKNEYVEIKQT